jgi:integrase
VTVGLLVYTREHHQIYRHSFNHHVWKPGLREIGIVNPDHAEEFHALRHFHASVLLDAGESIRALAEYLGHADPAFTLRTYTHLMPSSSERTRKAIDGCSATSQRHSGPHQRSGRRSGLFPDCRPMFSEPSP